MSGDAHQFVTTARVRATQILAQTGIGRACTLDEMKAVATITFDYPPKFRDLVSSDELARFRREGLTARSVSFSVEGRPNGPLGRVVFTTAGEPTQKRSILLKPQIGADALAVQVVEFMAKGKDPEFSPEMVISE